MCPVIFILRSAEQSFFQANYAHLEDLRERLLEFSASYCPERLLCGNSCGCRSLSNVKKTECCGECDIWALLPHHAGAMMEGTPCVATKGCAKSSRRTPIPLTPLSPQQRSSRPIAASRAGSSFRAWALSWSAEASKRGKWPLGLGKGHRSRVRPWFGSP